MFDTNCIWEQFHTRYNLVAKKIALCLISPYIGFIFVPNLHQEASRHLYFQNHSETVVESREHLIRMVLFLNLALIPKRWNWAWFWYLFYKILHRFSGLGILIIVFFRLHLSMHFCRLFLIRRCIWMWATEFFTPRNCTRQWNSGIPW